MFYVTFSSSRILYTVERAILSCRAISVAPVPWQWSASTLFLPMVRLRPKRIPFNFASSLPSFVRSSILCRSAWATADRMVTTINVHVSTRQTCFKNRLIRCVGNFGGSGVEPPINICFVLGSIQHRSS